jgi:hypothetical protein
MLLIFTRLVVLRSKEAVIPPYRDVDYPWAAGFAAKMPLKLS